MVQLSLDTCPQYLDQGKPNVNFSHNYDQAGGTIGLNRSGAFCLHNDIISKEITPEQLKTIPVKRSFQSASFRGSTKSGANSMDLFNNARA